MTLVAVVVVCAGVVLAVFGWITAFVRPRRELAEALSIPSDLVTTTSTGASGSMLALLRPDARRHRPNRGSTGLTGLVERARVPLRPSEVIAVGAGPSAATWLIAYAVTSSLPVSLLLTPATPGALLLYLRKRVARRRRALEEQLPEALSIMSSSMRAGHTLQRAVLSIAEGGEPPLSEELAQVVAETHLGVSIVDAMQHLGDRVEIREFVWLARAVTIQHTVGGRLADLLENLAEFTRGRHELQREVSALTAEGRASAWVLGMLPPMLLVLIHLTNPDYLAPMFEGWGPVVLAVCAASVLLGVWIIRRMVDFEL